MKRGFHLIRVSVVIPVYNGSKFLHSTFNSLAAQSLNPKFFEVIAVDDGSTDDSVQIIEELIKSNPSYQLRILKKKNGGVSSARNAGAREAAADIIGFLDQDAVAYPNWLESGIKKFDDPFVAAVEGRITPSAPFAATALTNILENETGGRFMTANFFIRKSVFDSVNGFDENFPYYLEDSDLAFTLLRRGYRISWSPDVRISHPYVQKTMTQHVWQMTKLAERIPLLLHKHQLTRQFCKSHGIPWHTMTACPLYFYGYYISAFLVMVGLALREPARTFIVALGTFIFMISYLVTLYARFRGRRMKLRETLAFIGWYVLIPYLRLYYLIQGSRKFKVPLRLI